jgi:hypothetical protein
MIGPALRYTNEQARRLERSVAEFTKLTNDDIYDLLKWAEDMREALDLIASTDPVDAALDPGRAIRVAQAVLDAYTAEVAA